MQGQFQHESPLQRRLNNGERNDRGLAWLHHDDIQREESSPSPRKSAQAPAPLADNENQQAVPEILLRPKVLSRAYPLAFDQSMIQTPSSLSDEDTQTQ